MYNDSLQVICGENLIMVYRGLKKKCIAKAYKFCSHRTTVRHFGTPVNNQFGLST